MKDFIALALALLVGFVMANGVFIGITAFYRERPDWRSIAIANGLTLVLVIVAMLAARAILALY